MSDFKMFDEHTLEENRQMTADYLLAGAALIAKNDSTSNTFKLLTAFSTELKKLEEQINQTAADAYPDEVETFIGRWEADLGIPDDIFDVGTTLEERRNNVIIKLAALGAQTAEDFIALAALFGITDIEIIPASDAATFPLLFPILFAGTQNEIAHLVIVKLPTELGLGGFPWLFPGYFSAGGLNRIEKLFNKLKPANVKFLYDYSL